jgi:hypothetical protein
MNTYRFLGTASDIAGYPALRHFGQQIKLPDVVARDAIRGVKGVPLIPEEMFAGIGFNDQELQAYALPVARRRAPDSFLDKQAQALRLLSDYRLQMEREFAAEIAKKGPENVNSGFDEVQQDPEPEATPGEGVTDNGSN